MKKIILSVLTLIAVTASAQEKDNTKATWKKAGIFNVLFNQSSFSEEWQGGGVNNIAVNGSVNYDINYKKGDITWDNKILAALGGTQVEGEQSKTDDRFELNSLLGRQATELWYYSAFLNLKTQLAQGFANGAKISDLFSPAYIQAGPGMLWKKSDNLKVNIAPATFRSIFVRSEFTKNAAAFGVDQGENWKTEVGTSLNAYYKFDLVKNVTVENILGVFGNYLQTNSEFDKVDFDYTLNIAMKVNKYLSANFIAQALYDANAVDAIQVRQVFGLGFNYKF